METHVIILPDEITTIALGATVAAACKQACVIYIYGNIGSGKTTWCRGFLRAFGYSGNVKSPTYTLVEPYQLQGWTIYHFDLYRLVAPEELELIGARDYFDDTALCLVEWPSKGIGFLPAADIELTLEYQMEGRRAHLQAISPQGESILTQINSIRKHLAT